MIHLFMLTWALKVNYVLYIDQQLIIVRTFSSTKVQHIALKNQQHIVYTRVPSKSRVVPGRNEKIRELKSVLALPSSAVEKGKGTRKRFVYVAPLCCLLFCLLLDSLLSLRMSVMDVRKNLRIDHYTVWFGGLEISMSQRLFCIRDIRDEGRCSVGTSEWMLILKFIIYYTKRVVLWFVLKTVSHILLPMFQHSINTYLKIFFSPKKFF